ncbi:hypothetical protein [Streptomyces sp. NPDC059165]|uniref:hypothetical protein n=1 Tax=Streptomyces sp. NPDC059165 TaxID=3346751 RepID=UPI0036C3AEFE
MNTRIVRAAGMAIMVVTVPLAGCSEGNSVDNAQPKATVAETARKFQQAVLERQWKTACEARTELLRGGTVAECVQKTALPSVHDFSDARLTTGDPFAVDAYGKHPAGMGLLLSVEADPARGLRWHTAVRLVPDADGKWLVDQLVHLSDEPEPPDTETLLAALRERG